MGLEWVWTTEKSEGEHDPDAKGEHQSAAREALVLSDGQQQEERRVDQVELLLDRQGPEVLEGRGGLGGGQVVGPDGRRNGSWPGTPRPTGRRSAVGFP